MYAWSVWSSAAEAALVDAYQFSGGPVPVRGLVLVLLWLVPLGWEVLKFVRLVGTSQIHLKGVMCS